MFIPTKRMDWLEEQIKIQENALVRCSSNEMAVHHAYLLQKLTDEWCKRTERGEVSTKTLLLCEG